MAQRLKTTKKKSARGLVRICQRYFGPTKIYIMQQSLHLKIENVGS